MNTPRILLLLLTTGIACAQAQDNPAPAPAAPEKPAEAPAVPQTEMQKWIATTDAQWQDAFKKGVTDVHEAEMNKVKLQYLNLLEEGIVKASKAGDLKGAVALRDEQKRFGDTQLYPEQDDAADAASVKQIRAVVRAQLAKANSDHAARIKGLHAKYDALLAQTQTQLTQRQRLDDALLVTTKRDEVAATWLAGIPATPQPTVAVGQPKPPYPAKPLGSAKALKDQIKILPYVQELGTVKFAPHDNRVPDELGVTVTGQQFQIAGSKKGTERHIMDRNTGHHGKVVLISAKAPQSGTVSAKVKARYYIAFELPNGTLKTKEIEVKPDTAYEWSVKTSENTLVFSVNKQGQPAEKGRELEFVESRGSEIKSFGFASTVRAPQDEADLTVTVIPASR